MRWYPTCLGVRRRLRVRQAKMKPRRKYRSLSLLRQPPTPKTPTLRNNLQLQHLKRRPTLRLLESSSQNARRPRRHQTGNEIELLLTLDQFSECPRQKLVCRLHPRRLQMLPRRRHLAGAPASLTRDSFARVPVELQRGIDTI